MATKVAATKSASAKPAAEKSTSKPAKAQALPPIASEDSADEGAAKLVAQLRVKDLIDRVIAATDQNRKDVRIVVEAALVELGKALAAGEVLNLQPLGKIRIANQRSDDTGVAMTLKLRRGVEKAPGKKADKEALAEVGEAG